MASPSVPRSALEAANGNGSTLTLDDGVIFAKNGPDILVTELCNLQIPDKGPGKKVELKQAMNEVVPVGRIIFDNNNRADPVQYLEGELKTDGGVIIRNGANVILKKNWTVNGRAVVGDANSPSILVTSGKLQPDAGTNLTVAHGLKVVGGSLWIHGGVNLTTITGNVTLDSNATLWLRPTVINNLPVQGQLKIVGNLNLKANSTVDFHVWSNIQNPQVNGTSKITVTLTTTIDAMAEFLIAGQHQDLVWPVLESQSYTDTTMPIIPANWESVFNEGLFLMQYKG